MLVHTYTDTHGCTDTEIHIETNIHTQVNLCPLAGWPGVWDPRSPECCPVTEGDEDDGRGGDGGSPPPRCAPPSISSGPHVALEHGLAPPSPARSPEVAPSPGCGGLPDSGLAI